VKRVVALLLSIMMLLTGCGQVQSQTTVTSESSVTAEPVESVESTTELVVSDEAVPQYDSLDDEDLLAYVEDLVYRDAVTSLNSDEYFVENVSTVYISKEYLEEVAFNSQSNIYFGYTLAELDEVFQGTKYIFTLSDDGTTTVQELQEIEDVSTETMLKNVAIGTGVILICVTVSVVSAGVGAPAVSMIFAASATTAETFAISGAAFGGISAGVVRGIETGDFNEAVEAAAMGATEGFKWGAISGAVVGGVSEGTALYGAAKQTSFTMNQYAQIQQETGYPLDVIKQFHTMEEYQAFRDANLKSTFVNNRSALIKTDIDLTRVDAKGRTNLERMQQGLAPQDSNGVSYELHHVGQKKDGTLAILSQTEHDNPAIHGFLEKTEAHAAGTNWDAERQAFWKAFAKIVG
jgi:hypothetical protein